MSGLAPRKSRYDDDELRAVKAELAALRQERAEGIALSRASRAAHDRAMREDLTERERRVFAAVRYFTVDWGRWDDEVYLAQLGTQAGIGGTAKSRATEAGRAARRLGELGIIDYEGRRGRGVPSRIGIPHVVLSAVKGGTSALFLAPEEPQEKESPEAEKESETAEKESPCNSPTRRDPEDLSENPDAGGRATGTDPPSIGDVLASGVFDQGSKPTDPPNRPPPGVVDELLRAIARAVPAAAGRELLDDRSQGPGRTTLRALLGRLEALIGFEAAVACIAGEWPRRVHTSAMAVAIGRARVRLDPPPAAAEPAAAGPPGPPRQVTLDDDSPPQPPIWEPPAETARSPPPEAERAAWRQALNRTPRSNE